MSITFITSLPTSGRYLYTLVPTEWGPLALVSHNEVLCRLIFGFPNQHSLQKTVLNHYPSAQTNNSVLKKLQQNITDYFLGNQVDFTCKVDISWAGDFTRSVLRRCAQIKPGQSINYGTLAQKIRYPRAARAVGWALAQNRIPLIIPCHRVVAVNGQLGGYSAPGGVALKKRLLEHEAVFRKINPTM